MSKQSVKSANLVPPKSLQEQRLICAGFLIHKNTTIALWFYKEFWRPTKVIIDIVIKCESQITITCAVQ